MQERIFTLKKGTEVPAQFDGVTIPFQVPSNNQDMLTLAGDNAYLVFNEAYALRVQKSVKDDAQDEGMTVEGLRQAAADYKIGQVRTRKAGTGTGAPRVTANQVDRVLGEDFLSMLTPEQRKLYDEKKAALKAKPAAPVAEASAAPTEAPAEAAPQTDNGGRKRR